MFGIASASPIRADTYGLRPVPCRSAPAPVESWTATAADVEAWLKSAKPGDLFVYARGPFLIRGGAASLVRKLREEREVSPHQRRDAQGVLEYVVVRNKVVKPKPRPPVIDPNMMHVLLVVQDAAFANQRCPSNAEIGEQIGLSAGQVGWQLQKLEQAGMITRRTVPCRFDARFRVIRVCATGCETKGPQS